MSKRIAALDPAYSGSDRGVTCYFEVTSHNPKTGQLQVKQISKGTFIAAKFRKLANRYTKQHRASLLEAGFKMIQAGK